MSYDLLLPARGLGFDEAIELGVLGEQCGWRGTWCSEVLGLDALVVAAGLLLRTSRVRVGTAIVPISTRSAAVLAMAASSLAQAAPGRFHLGLGLSTPKIVTDRHDRPVGSPLAEARGTVEVVRRALRGETVDSDRSPHVSDLRIEAPADPPPVLLGALGPKMTRLAIEGSDGLVLNLVPPADATQRAVTAKDCRGPNFPTYLVVRTVVDPTEDDLDSLTRELTSYARVPAYARALRACGLDVLGDGLTSGTSVSSQDALRLREELSVTGSMAECREQLDGLVEAGVTPLVLPVGDPQGFRRTIESLGSATVSAA